MPQGKRPMPNSGTDSSSSDGSDSSTSDSDSSASIQLVEKKNNKKKTNNAADSDVEVLEPENNEGGSCRILARRRRRPRLLLSQGLQRRWRRNATANTSAVSAWFGSPLEEIGRTTKRADTVHKYFASAPRLPDPSGLQVALFKRVSQDIRRNPDWLNDEECSRTQAKGRAFVWMAGINCFIFWQRPMNCPTCKAGAKPLNVGWVTPSATETATQKERRKQRKKEKAKRDARRNAAKKVKRNAKAAAEEKNRRDAEAVLAPGLTMKDGILHYR
ncbi:hypothetical protein B0H14DRAFT_2622838 [Mycena olivaceomarginata]|nr:hypothetical protein B0H14DRAFT_2622838 [Mycena olivaceomarginata]